MDLQTVYFDHYRPAKAATRRESTVVGYDSAIRLRILPAIGERDITEISPKDVQAMVDAIERPGAALKALKTLRQVVRWWARREQLHMPDPTQFVELRPLEPYSPKTLDASETRRMLRGLFGHELEAVAICAVTLGLRRGEACGLRWEDIDLRSGEVRVVRSRQTVDGVTKDLAPKTARSRRTLVLPAFARKRLRALRKRVGYLCGDMRPDAVARALEAFCRRKGLPWVSMTNLRHTWATLAVEAGVGIETVALMLGHTELGTAYEHYIIPRLSICKAAQAAWEGQLMKAA